MCLTARELSVRRISGVKDYLKQRRNIIKTRRFVATALLIVFLAFSVSFPASAQAKILGTESDITGYIVPDNEQNDMQSRIIKDPVNWDDGSDYYSEIFSITVKDVTYLDTSSEYGERFRKSDLPTDAVRIICKAQLSNSLQDEVGMSNLHEWIYAGVCYYGYNELYGENTYISVYDENVPEGKLGEQYEFDFLIDTYLDDDKTYYSFVKNASERGYVYGSVKLFYSYFEE